MGNCMKPDYDVELLRGIAIDLKVQGNPPKAKNTDDLFWESYYYKKRSHKFRIHEVFDPY